MRMRYICPQCKRLYFHRSHTTCYSCNVSVVPERLVGSRSLKARIELAKLMGDETQVATLTMEKQARKAVRAQKSKERKLKLAKTKILIMLRLTDEFSTESP